MALKHLTNLPKDEEFTVARHDQTPYQAILERKKYLRDKLIGDPAPTKQYTTEQLKEMGMIGVYSPDAEQHS